MRLRFWRSNLALHYFPPILRCVVSPRHFLTLASPSAVLARCLQLTLFTPHRFCSFVSLSPSLSLCFSFATLCTRVKTIFLCLRAVTMRDTYSFLLTIFSVFCCFSGLLCSPSVRNSIPCIYVESVARFALHSSNRHEGVFPLTYLGSYT